MIRPLFIFAPGAGAPSSHPWMQKWKARLADLGRVETFNYDYMREGRRRPDPLPLLIAAHRQALAQAGKEDNELAILIGKSMGGRIGCHVALVENVTGVICLGYPLCGGGDPSKLRDGVLRELRTPTLFVQGTRDLLCPLPLLDEVRAKMRAPNQIHIIEGGDHSLQVLKRKLVVAGETQDDVDQRIAAAIGRFVASLISS